MSLITAAVVSAASTHILSSSSSDASSSSSSTPEQLSRHLIFSTPTLSASVLVACFLITLTSTTLPFILIRGDGFTRTQIIALSLWHAFIAGVLLTSAWCVFLPNMLSVSHHLPLPTPILPFMLLFLALLLPLLLDRFMLWLVGSKKRLTQAETTDAESMFAQGTITPSNVPSTPMQRVQQHQRGTSGAQSATPSRKQSTAGVYGSTSDAMMYDERKGLLTGGVPSVPTPRSSSFARRAADENAPLTGSDLEVGTPHSTPGWTYGSARQSVDAMEFKAKQPYLARCAFCKENITTAKGKAYHAVGCHLKNFHAFSFSSRWMQGLRGRRSVQREIVMHEEEGREESGVTQSSITMSILCYLLVLCAYNIVLAGGVNLQHAGMVLAQRDAALLNGDSVSTSSATGEFFHALLVGLVMICFTWYYGFSLGMMMRLHRMSISFGSILVILLYALSLPCSIGLNYLLATHIPSARTAPQTHATYDMYLLICQCSCVGVLIYCSFCDMILEEWARKEAIGGKTLTFALGAALVCTVAIFAPMY